MLLARMPLSRHQGSSKMELATFGSADQLLDYFTNVDGTVGPRQGPNRRTHDQKEFYNLRQYLATLAAEGHLPFPLTVEKVESPDFLLTDGVSRKWGLEVTEATTQEWQRELTITEGHETSLQPLGRDGWVRNSAERETCAAILRAMRKKAHKIQVGKYRPASRYDVLIYVNVRAFFYDADETVGLLAERISRWNSRWAALGRVSVITSLYLYYDVTDNRTRMPLFKFEPEQYSLPNE